MGDLDEVVIVDVSHWQGLINWLVLKAMADGAYIKATDNIYVDSKFERNSGEATRLEVPWGAYHFFRPGSNPVAQANAFIAAIGHFDHTGKYILHSDLTPAVDVEYRPLWVSKTRAYADLKQFLLRVYAATRIRPYIYTRKSWWETNMPVTDLDEHHDGWFAHYNSYVSEPWIPREWGKDWTMWQWSADGNGRGLEFGVQSKSIDINRYNGGYEQLKRDYPEIKWVRQEQPDPEPEPEPPVDEPDTCNGVHVVEKTLKYNMRVRSAIIPSIKNGKTPGVIYGTSKVYFILYKGNKVEVLEHVKDGENIWARVGVKQFIAEFYDGKLYLE